MIALRELSRAGPLAALVGRAETWLLAPRADTDSSPSERAPKVEPPVVAVVGLAPRAGATTIARALAARLARWDPAGAAILFSADSPPRPALGTRAAVRLARRLEDRGSEGVKPAGRICLVPAAEPLAPIALDPQAPIVIDVQHGQAAETALSAAVHVALIAQPDYEPTLATAVERSLREAGRGVTLIVNRSVPEDRCAGLAIADSPLAARAARACRGPHGALSDPIAELAERCLAEAHP